MEKLNYVKKRLKISLIYRMAVLVVFGVAALLGGCSDPTALGRFQAAPVTNVILDSIGVVDEEPEPFEDARDPLPSDLVVAAEEYVVHSGDIIDISIMDLFQSGLEWSARRQVSETGRVNFPEIGTVKVTGRTELEVIEDIKSLLSPNIIKDPIVNVVVVGPTAKIYTVSGTIASPGRYPISEPGLRLLEALAQAGGIPALGVNYAYVLRKPDEQQMNRFIQRLEQEDRLDEDRPVSLPQTYGGLESRTWPDTERLPAESGIEPMWGQQIFEEIVEPETGRDVQEDRSFTPSSFQEELQGRPKPDRQKEREGLLELIEPSDPLIQPMVVGGMPSGQSYSESSGSEALSQSEKPFEVIRTEEGGFRLVPKQPVSQTTEPTPLSPPGADQPWAGQPYQEPEEAIFPRQEVIRIDLNALQSGDLSQNIVIRAGDHIRMRPNSIGIYYAQGQVARPGPYQLSGTKMTLKEAIAAVGSFTPLACPSRCDITRRIGNDREVTCRINLQKLLEGSQPNLFIRPNDIINVGSHPLARWWAVIRQSFRSTYGFGFVYDRNLADKDFGH